MQQFLKEQCSILAYTAGEYGLWSVCDPIAIQCDPLPILLWYGTYPFAIRLRFINDSFAIRLRFLDDSFAIRLQFIGDSFAIRSRFACDTLITRLQSRLRSVCDSIAICLRTTLRFVCDLLCDSFAISFAIRLWSHWGSLLRLVRDVLTIALRFACDPVGDLLLD